MDQQASGSGNYDPDVNHLFPSKEYLKRFIDPKADPMMIHVKFLEAYHNFYSKYENGTNDLLEFGGGPTLHTLITASTYVESIWFADYAESNRNEISMWKDQTRGAHDWSEYFKYVLTELEGNTAEGAVESREQELREKIREVVKCNIRSDDEFLDSSAQEFDIIQTNLCLEAACESMVEFSTCIRTLGTLLKPGGYLVCLTTKGGAWYTCDGEGDKFFMLKIEEEDIVKAFRESGLSLLESYNIQPKENPLSAAKSFQFTVARKK